MKKIWNFLNGKKTVIAGAYWGLVIPAMMIIFPNGAPHTVDKIVSIIGLVLTYAGLGHKVLKSTVVMNLGKKEKEPVK